MDTLAPKTAELPPPPRGPMGPAPLRRSGSVRRTSSIDVTWPEGRYANMRLLGRARDIQTPVGGGEPRLLDEAQITVAMSADRTIRDIEAAPTHPRIRELIGARGGGHLRQALLEVVPEDRAAGRTIYLPLDDLSGASLVAGWAYSRWTDDWMRRSADAPAEPRKMIGICTGFAPGSSSLNPDGTSRPHDRSRAVPPLRNPDDPEGWHPLPSVEGAVSFRRARRIDVWVDGDLIHVDSSFQDSATTPEGGRRAVHEYGLTATADRTSGRLLGIEADARILPYLECPGAAANVGRLLGQSLDGLRTAVIDLLPGPLGCTHLNDAMRALAEVPILAAAAPVT